MPFGFLFNKKEILFIVDHPEVERVVVAVEVHEAAIRAQEPDC